MTDRYYTTEPITSDQAVLVGAEAHHLAHVMRQRPGARVTLFDGSGAEFTAEIQRVGRDRVELEVLAREAIDREAPLEVTLAVALPKGERSRWLVEKTVELGVARLVPLVTERGVTQPASSTLDRLRRTVIEASKQCGRNRLLEIAAPSDVADFVRRTESPLRWFAHPLPPDAKARAAADLEPNREPSPLVGEGRVRGKFSDSLLAAVELSSSTGATDRAALAIGPEGGFTDHELSQAVAAGWRVIDLGPRILRVETAALALAALAIGLSDFRG